MVENKTQVQALCEKYNVEFTGAVIVTAAGNIYLTGNIDPADKSKRFSPDDEDGEADAGDFSDQKQKTKKPKKVKTNNGIKRCNL